MNIYLKSVIITVLVLLLHFSSMLQFAFADKYSIQMGSRFGIPSYEQEYDKNICGNITTFATLAGYDPVCNWYGAGTDDNAMFTAAYSGVWNSYANVFYYGHGGSEWHWNWAGWIWYREQQWFITEDNGYKVFDYHFYDWSEGTEQNSQGVRLVYLWSCYQGDTIGGIHLSGTPFGMANGFMHSSSLSTDGYTNPDDNHKIFIGFSGVVPYLTDDYWTEDESYLQDAGYNFLYYFYYYTLIVGYSINTALDRAVQHVWGVQSYEDSILYKGYDLTEWETGKVKHGQMKVYGDGSQHIRINPVTPTKITIQSQPTTDHYSRSHGMSIDEPLPNGWWGYSGYQFKVTSKAFTYEKNVYLTYGSHYVEYAASGYVPNYAWHAKIYINDVLKAEGDVGRYTHLRADFAV